MRSTALVAICFTSTTVNDVHSPTPLIVVSSARPPTQVRNGGREDSSEKSAPLGLRQRNDEIDATTDGPVLSCTVFFDTKKTSSIKVILLELLIFPMNSHYTGKY
ncbi:hypothetical protein COOONC_11174 [Cooperia oncophora]